jgi:hypothetical protein
MDEERIIKTVTWAVENNFDIILMCTDVIDYQEQRLLWDDNKYYIKNLKIDCIMKEIKNYINDNKKFFIKILLNDLKNNLESFLINIPWDIIEKTKIEKSL